MGFVVSPFIAGGASEGLGGLCARRHRLPGLREAARRLVVVVDRALEVVVAELAQPVRARALKVAGRLVRGVLLGRDEHRLEGLGVHVGGDVADGDLRGVWAGRRGSGGATPNRPANTRIMRVVKR